MEEIEAFGTSERSAGEPYEPPAVTEGEVVYRGPVWIGGAERGVVCRRSPEGYGLDIAGVGRVEVAGDGAWARVEVREEAARGAQGLAASLPAETALGPALVLALALGGTFCLHASALVLPAEEDGGDGAGERIVAFLGPTGAGKSTLARLLDGALPGWLRAADDVLPVVWTAEGPRARPRFPQLKLPAGAQPGPTVPESLPLAGLYLLAGPSDAADRSDGRAVDHRLSPREAVLALVRNTVAARLFDGALLDRHLDLCVGLGERPGVAKLHYPWTGDLVPGLAEAVASGSGGA